MHRLLLPFKQSRLLNTIFLSNIFITFHYALIIYVNSTFLNNFFSETQVSALYIIGSIINTILLIYASKILEKIGIYKFAIYCILMEFLATLGLAVSTTTFLIGLYFLIHLTTISLLFFNMDMFIEDVSKDDSLTGSIRATYLTVANIVFVISPSLVALLLFNNIYSFVYIASCLFLIPLYYFFRRLKGVKNPVVQHIRIKETLSEYIKNKNLYNIFISNFLLQLFYAYMVIYVPTYLHLEIYHIGFSWSEIGIMFTIMLLPFVFFELPVGEMADDKYGEKEFLTVGFIIMGLSTLFISFLTVKVFWIWAILLFITRIGASFVEISSESYFFKQVNPEKSDVISFFRITRPLSFIIAPLLAILTLQFIPFQYIFIIIGSLMILGTKYSLALNDTK
ncbi:MAG: MFS transporter [Candidatus Zambryskibacteria bacterium]|nr:MFS transporter [Candidatus Zambryskibacteria bacterium]